MNRYIFSILFSLTSLFAQQDYSFRVTYGKVTSSDLNEILSANVKNHPSDLRVLSFDGGYLLGENIYDLPIDVYAQLGLSRFFEDNTQDDVYEVVAYIKLYWKFPLLKRGVRFGLGEGISYTDEVLMCEYLEATQDKEPYAQFLNYLDISIDVDLGKLVGVKKLQNTYIGWTIKHRSGVFGLYSGVHGGSNYNTISVQSNF